MRLGVEVAVAVGVGVGDGVAVPTLNINQPRPGMKCSFVSLNIPLRACYVHGAGTMIPVPVELWSCGPVLWLLLSCS